MRAETSETMAEGETIGCSKPLPWEKRACIGVTKTPLRGLGVASRSRLPPIRFPRMISSSTGFPASAAASAEVVVPSWLPPKSPMVSPRGYYSRRLADGRGAGSGDGVRRRLGDTASLSSGSLSSRSVKWSFGSSNKSQMGPGDHGAQRTSLEDCHNLIGVGPGLAGHVGEGGREEA